MTHREGPSAREVHYGTFYGLEPLPQRFVVVHGNCQAEAIRILLDPQLPGTVRLPPVHELTADDLPYVQRTYRAATALIAQPVADDYRGLPLGTAQVFGLLPAGSPLAMFPVLRWAALHPYHLLARSATVPDPPLVPYYDVRTIAAAADLPAPQLTAEGVRQVAARTREELIRRQKLSGTVPADDLFVEAGARGTNTINHPGNPVLIGVAERILERLGAGPQVADPGRELLRSVFAPLEAATLEALGLSGAPRPGWVVDGAPVSQQAVDRTHREWLRTQPEALALAIRAAAGWLGQRAA